MRTLREMFFGPQLLVGLDIGSHSVKLAKLRRLPSGSYELAACQVALLPREAIVDGRIMRSAVVIERIREMAMVAGCAKAECALAIPGYGVIIKNISFPQMTPEELEESIQWQAEQYIPFDINDVNIDALILHPEASPKQDLMKVLLVAAKKDEVAEYISVAREAGLRPVIVEPSIFALLSTLRANHDISGQTVACVNIGANVINLGVFAKGVMMYTRDIFIGGSSLTEDIMQNLDIPYDQAEAIKIKEPDDDGGREEISGNTESMAKIVTKIQRATDFVIATLISDVRDRVYLTGGSANFPGLAKELEEKLATTVQLIDPFREMAVDTSRFNKGKQEQMAPVASVAVGLAMRLKGDKGINLLAQRKKAKSLLKPKFLRFPLSVSVNVPLTSRRYTLTLSKSNRARN